MWLQRTIRLPAKARGFHLVTAEEVAELPELEWISVGLVHLLIQHTSASLALNENAAPEVRQDFESWFDRAVPEDAPYWTHTLEGPDDMPAHIKAALLGPSLTLPVRRRPPRARHLAGHLPLRAPRPRRPALAGGHRLG
jgi:secondary thiamine-phosphate synthase enzyme